MFPRMKVVVKLFEEASRVVQSIPLILFTPIFTFVMLTIFFGYWLFVMLFVATAGKFRLNLEIFSCLFSLDLKLYESPWQGCIN